MYEVFIKDFINGTKLIRMEMDQYTRILDFWKEGKDLEFEEFEIKNENIESLYIRKKTFN